jgi:hypothetical protein
LIFTRAMSRHGERNKAARSKSNRLGKTAKLIASKAGKAGKMIKPSRAHRVRLIGAIFFSSEGTLSDG